MHRNLCASERDLQIVLTSANYFWEILLRREIHGNAYTVPYVAHSACPDTFLGLHLTGTALKCSQLDAMHQLAQKRRTQRAGCEVPSNQ